MILLGHLGKWCLRTSNLKTLCLFGHLSSTILVILNWTRCKFMFESHIGHYSFPNHWDLSPYVTRIWRRRKETRRNLPCRKWNHQTAPISISASDTEFLSPAIALLNWVQVAERSRFYPGMSFGNLPKPRCCLYFLLLCLSMGFSAIRTHHSLLPFSAG